MRAKFFTLVEENCIRLLATVLGDGDLYVPDWVAAGVEEDQA